MRRRKIVAGASLLVLAVVTRSVDASVIESVIEVHLKEQSFRPKTISAKPGDTIVFSNDDNEVHSVFLPDNEKMLAEHFIEPHTRYEVAIPITTTAATYDLVCTVHMMMKGTLIIAK